MGAAYTCHMYGDELWYVSFGSNMLETRFRKYLPDWPAAKYGLHDFRRFRRDLTIAHPLYFAGASAVWDDSAVAFVSLRADPDAVTYCRAYRVTPGEFCRIITGENGVAGVRWHPELIPERVGDCTDLAMRDDGDPRRGKYNALLRVDTVDGLPAVTVTTSRRLPRRAPSPRYLDAVAAGLGRLAPDGYLADAVRRSAPVAV